MFEGPENRYVQYMGGASDETYIAEVVGPSYIEAGPEFYTGSRLADLARLGFALDDEHSNFQRSYESCAWAEASAHATSLLRDVLAVEPGDVNVRVLHDST
jgi:hypothetical protein